MNIEIRTRYAVDDPEMKSDYCAIDIYVNGIHKQSYGDYYHDKGYDKMQGWLNGFINGISLFDGELNKVIYTHKADYEI